MCGEQKNNRTQLAVATGSSPRVRGTADRTHIPRIQLRFIPACAGNRDKSIIWAASVAVHPRVCGEQIQHGDGQARSGGSSPRVRGTALVRHHQFSRSRFIPACAGNSAVWGALMVPIAVHPRVCGEQDKPFDYFYQSLGSSPRVRGTALMGRVRTDLDRFIPACAGNRGPCRSLQQRKSVHPRVCGEQWAVQIKSRMRFGSSPRVRGTAQRTYQRNRSVRFIPACAGNRRAETPLPVRRAVHPRVCGEQFRQRLQLIDRLGSSPRVRGTEEGDQ